jgi:hypothetical protein
MVRTLTKTLAERRRGHKLDELRSDYVPGREHKTLDWQPGRNSSFRYHLYSTGWTPQPGDIPNQQGVFIIRKGRTVRLHDILPEDWKKDFDPDDTVEDPATSESLTSRHDGSTTVRGLIGFVDENEARAKNQKAEKAQKRSEKNARRAAAAARSEESSKLSPYQRAIRDANRRQFIERKRERDAEVHDTRQNGVFWKGGYMADRYVPPFTEYFGPNVTRSDLHPMIKLWVSTIPAKVRVGADKTFVEPHWSKQQGLLFPYVEGDANFCRWIFRELDGALYDSPESLVGALRQILETADEFKDDPDAKNMLPNLITGHVHEDGTFEGGHLIWLLEPKKHVWMDEYRESVDEVTGEVTKSGDPRWRKGPIEKLKKVSNSLCKLLLPLGADPGQTNFRKPKAPTSPFISVIVANEDNLFELDDFTKIRNYPTHANVKAMMRDAALIRAKAEGLNRTLSMERWNKTKDITSAVALAGRVNCDREFTIAQDKSVSTGNPKPLATWIEREARLRVAKETDLDQGPGLDWVIAKQAIFAAKLYMKPKSRKTKRQPIRGRDRDHVVKLAEVDPTLPIKERAAVEEKAKKDVRTARREEAGRRSGKQKGHRQFYVFKENVYTWITQGGARDWNIFREEGLWACCVNTARKYWKRALADLFPQTQIGERRYIADAGTTGETAPSVSIPVYIVLESGRVVLNPSVQWSKTVDPPPPDPGIQPSTAGPPDRPWPNHTLSSADVRPAVVSRVLETA